MNMKFYLPKEELVEHENFFNKDWERKEELKVEVIKNGIVLPFVEDKDKPFSHSFCGILNLDFNEVELARHYRYKKDYFSSTYNVDKNGICKINKTAVFLGYYFNHFGHSLIESLTRVWYCIDNINPDYDYVFIPIGGYVSDEMFNPFMEQLELFGFNKNQIKFVDKIIQYDEIIVPEQSWGLNSQYHYKQIEVFNKIASKVEEADYKKVYFSRTKLALNNLFGEEMFEEIFKNNGYEIIYPETLSIKKQISIIKGAEKIAGISGSALHMLVYANKNTNLIAFNRLQWINLPQIIINKMKNLDFKIIKANIGFLPVLHGPGPFLIGLCREVIDFFNDNSFNINDVKYNFENAISKYVIKWIEAYSEFGNSHEKNCRNWLIEQNSKQNSSLTIVKLLQLFEPLDYLNKNKFLITKENNIITKKKLTTLQKTKREIKRILKQIKVK